MFIDRVEIEIKAGSGGNGCVSFRREKHVPRGGPDGGDGGAGGDIVIRVNPQMRTLLDLRYRRRYRAENGRPGQGARKTGRSGGSVTIEVPPGTVVEDLDTGGTLVDLVDADSMFHAAKGGKGGKGNYAFRSAVDQAPRRSTPGSPGEERRLRLTLKLIADVGLVGLPNAGKSTLLRSLSDAHPVVASYPFSTTAPVLGMVRVDETASFCMVDIPGLIEGAHAGRGLGIEFLRHIERCRVLLVLIDATGEAPPEEAYGQLVRELRLYSERLLERPRLVALNKIDLPTGGEVEFRGGPDDRVFRISALARTGLGELVGELYREVTREVSANPPESDPESIP
jgi:GTP-binding protein